MYAFGSACQARKAQAAADALSAGAGANRAPQSTFIDHEWTGSL
ncbi:hypothetical protein ABSH63_10460 [Sinimarinibacterium sp. HSW-8]|uniref:Uncharacterized protein n=1 Tax=Sinimarinibacterium thermocellulolyticum TaxID=3170016 RepID=A0ABV2AC78_9GAMM